MPADQSRNFVFTNYALEHNYETMVTESSLAEYIAYAPETCPSTRRPHHQGWIRLRIKKSTSSASCIKISKQLGLSWMSAMRGTLVQNDLYCGKDSAGELIEFGERPKQGERGDLKQIVESIRNNTATAETVLMDDPMTYHVFGRTMHAVETVMNRNKWRTKQTHGIFIHGLTGLGKSHFAYRNYDASTHYVKNAEETFWDGYRGQPTVILNELRYEIPYQALLALADKWPHTVKIKCREPVPFLATQLIITSSLSPEEMYPDKASSKDKLDQFYRRFTVIELKPDTSEYEIAKHIHYGRIEILLGNIARSVTREKRRRPVRYALRLWQGLCQPIVESPTKEADAGAKVPIDEGEVLRTPPPPIDTPGQSPHPSPMAAPPLASPTVDPPPLRRSTRSKPK